MPEPTTAPTHEPLAVDGEPAPRAGAGRDAIVSVLTCLVALFAADVGFRRSVLGRRLAAESQYVAKSTHFTESRVGADVAITGDSRILHGFNPRVVQDVIRAERGESLYVYNAGLSGAPPMTQLAMIRRMLSHTRRPRVVIMSISPYMFSSRIYRPTARESLTTIYRVEDIPSAFRAGAEVEDLATILSVNLFQTLRFRPRILDTYLRLQGPREPENIGVQGFIQNGEVDPYTQDARGRSRALGYRTEMWPPATFGNEHMGYFIEALRALRSAHVTAIVMNSPSASQMVLAYGPTSMYDRHIRWIRERAAEFNARYFDAQNSPAITDEDYNDGDHLGGIGAGHFSAWLAHEAIVPALGGRRADRPGSCRTLFDFEAATLDGWTLSGDAFAEPIRVQARRGQHIALAFTGHRFATTFTRDGDLATGIATSPTFTLEGGTVRVRVAGSSSARLGVELVVDGEVVASARGRDDEQFRDAVWNTGPHRGRPASVRIRDEGTGAWEHLQVDDVASCP